MGYIGMCRCEGYGFQAVYSRIGYINQSVSVQNRVSFFRKLISWLKILSRLGKQLLQDRGIWGVYSSIGQQNSAELALVQVKGSRVPAAHPHPEIPKVPPPGSKCFHSTYCMPLCCSCSNSIDGLAQKCLGFCRYRTYFEFKMYVGHAKQQACTFGITINKRSVVCSSSLLSFSFSSLAFLFKKNPKIN